MEKKAYIRHAVLVEGKSRRAVAEETGHSRNTIRKMLLDSKKPKYQMKEERQSPVLGPYKEKLAQWVEEDSQKPKKKRRTAKRMYHLLRDEHGYRGAESTVRYKVGQLRRKAKRKVYIPLAYEPGETAQVDFGEAEVQIGGEVVRVYLFVMWLGYSGATFVQAYPAESQEVFFAGHVAAFDFFGGVPQEVWYDNLTNAVRKVLKGSQREEQESFLSFRTHYLFGAEYCNVASGWEKGGVEGRVGYARRNWLIGAGEFASWDALNAYLYKQCQQEQERRLRGREQSMGERLAQEQSAMRPLPTTPYPCCKTVPVKANHLSLVSFATNRYSVPVEKGHEKLTLRAYVHHLEICCSAEIIARHERCWQREQDILDPQHYLPLLAKRPRAFAHAQAIRQWRKRWPPIFDSYLARLKESLSSSEATRQFIEILQLGQHYSEAELAAALEEAVRRHCLDKSDIRELLRRLTEPDRPAPAQLTNHPQLSMVEVALPDLAHFNQLLTLAHASINSSSEMQEATA